MLHLYKNNNFMFYHIYKCGGTSITRMLRDTKAHGGLTIGDTNRPVSECADRLGDYNLYANIRNPYDRIVSMCAFAHQSVPCTIPYFKDFFYNAYLKNAEYWLTSQQETLFVDGKLPENIFLIKLEEVDKHWPIIMKRHFGVDVQCVPKLNTSVHDKTMSYFDDDMIKCVKEKEAWAIDQYCLY
jgi:hypothetical protein